MMLVDVNCSIGGVPYRAVPHPEAAILVKVLAREGVKGAWVGHLPSAFVDDPHPLNDALIEALAPFAGVLAPAITLSAQRAGWEQALARGIAGGAVAVRTYGAGPGSRALAVACGAARVPLMLTVHLERAAAAAFTGADAKAVGDAVRASPAVRVVVAGAERALIEEVHAALAPAERARVWWEISRIAGPPADDLAELLRAIGGARFLYGSGWPLRLTQVPKANLELLPDDLAGMRLADTGELR